MLIIYLVTLMLVFSILHDTKDSNVRYFPFFILKNRFSKHQLYFEIGLCDLSSHVVIMCQLQNNDHFGNIMKCNHHNPSIDQNIQLLPIYLSEIQVHIPKICA